ncbi:unnamed protein product [Oikopleura dioica]|uniref:Uncharacterized protein n=1 Tax=Oikopleura dioica TaxID=34765 RepID=E4YUD0_OIKDI|nr:unnamed protein product [Oikopleura dioica]
MDFAGCSTRIIFSATTTTSTTTTTTTSTSTTTTPTTTEEQTTTTVDPCPCTAEVRDAMNTNEPNLSKWSMYKVVFQGDTMDYFQFASAAVVGKQSYQQYYIMSQKACTVAGLEGFRDENFRAYFLDLHNAEAHDLTTPMTNYQSFNSVYYRNNAGEAGKHKSVTFGFRADKTKTDVTGNHKQDKMMVALQNNMDFDLLYDCLGTAKPVTIDTDAAGVIPTCDYAKCVGQEIMVGW